MIGQSGSAALFYLGQFLKRIGGKGRFIANEIVYQTLVGRIQWIKNWGNIHWI